MLHHLVTKCGKTWTIFSFLTNIKHDESCLWALQWRKMPCNDIYSGKENEFRYELEIQLHCALCFSVTIVQAQTELSFHALFVLFWRIHEAKRAVINWCIKPNIKLESFFNISIISICRSIARAHSRSYMSMHADSS